MDATADTVYEITGFPIREKIEGNPAGFRRRKVSRPASLFKALREVSAAPCERFRRSNVAWQQRISWEESRTAPTMHLGRCPSRQRFGKSAESGSKLLWARD